MYYIVYVILNEFGKLYIGYTGNLEKRLKRHNGELAAKKTSYTARNKGHWRVFYKEEFLTRREAMKREKELKSSAGRRFLKSKI